MNHGNIHNPHTQAGKLYSILLARPGQLFDAFDLAARLPTTCIGTIVAEVRSQLDQTHGQNPEHVCKGRKRHYYRLNVGQMEMGI